MKDKGTSELKKIEETKAPGTLFTAAPATSANEAFRRVNEDPLLRMRFVDKSGSIANPDHRIDILEVYFFVFRGGGG